MDLRRLSPADAALWREIRLEALEREPEQFASRHEDHVERPLADFAARLAGASVWAAFDGERPVAVAALTPDDEGVARGWVESVYVRPEARGRGLGQAVLGALEQVARDQRLDALWLEVRASNAAARGLYARLGFREVEGAPKSCAHRCEVTMAKTL
ncbi:GNAT family N-acetyltransferase [Frigidibacter sp. SD6-1]|uniref:GNAT family N-acetyltransferase n=1 Tax=Frigidibacter sp. SD6-1 TaxID=3032581 RepID=UPI0024DF5DF7|nr:GNAT family N-acetyltransferase [Frigidibacter sp. SD6-1]